MDALDKLIMENRAERQNLRDALMKKEAEIAALELAARLRPAPTRGHASREDVVGGDERRTTNAASRHGGGRKSGDISHAWRGVLAGMYAQNKRLSYEGIHAVTLRSGLLISLSSVRDRVRSFISTGLVEGGPEIGFAVTQDAVKRFGFTKENDPPKGGSDATDATTSVFD